MLLAVEVVSPSLPPDGPPAQAAVLAEAGVPAYWRVELDGPGRRWSSCMSSTAAVYREVGTVRGGEAAVVDVPFRVELRPAELTGPRRRA